MPPFPSPHPLDLSSRKWGGSPRVERSPALNPVTWSSLHPRNHLGGFLTATEAGPHTQKLQIGVSAAVERPVPPGSLQAGSSGPSLGNVLGGWLLDCECFSPISLLAWDRPGDPWNRE